MNPALYSGARALVQYGVSWLFAHFAILGQFADPSVAAEWILTAVVGAGYVYLANWLGTREGEEPWPKLARLAAKVLMLGLAKTPNYHAPEPKA